MGITTLVLIGLSSCNVAPPPTSNPSSTSSPTSSATPTPSPSVQPSSPSVTPTPPVKTTTINLYKVDSQCNRLTPEKVTIAAKQSLEGAIAKVLEETDSGDFSIAGYRVSREGDRAIVDLRLPANAKRQFRSLSSCEQLALFGGLRKTLTENAQWKIKSVQFTEKGEEIVL
ncbi:MAG: hypothetical protein ACAF41_21965 [Leptolyngbya sp. BL-A-14]